MATDRAPQAPVEMIGEWLGSVRLRTPDADEFAALDELMPQGADLPRYLRQFAILTALSAAIASFGLLADSGAVVIGAMLVAPLMTPIVAAAAATVTAHNDRLVKAIAIIASGTFLAIAVGWLVALVAAGRVIDVSSLPDEIRGRTFPGLLDLGIAITAGAAAGYVQPRRSTIAALPGVGIAVALVPPLATVGITLQLGLADEASNALLLYLTNLAAIVFSAAIVLILSGFRPSDEAGRRTLGVRLAVTLLAVAAVAVPLTLHTRSAIADLQLRSSVVAAVEDWDPDVDILDQMSDVADSRATVSLLLVGQGDPRPVYELAEAISTRFGGPVDLQVRYQSDRLFVVSVR